MRIAVCCPGPSLPRRWHGRAGYDLVYAVNRALIPVPDADWLSAGDSAMFEDLLPDGLLPRVGVVTMPDVRDRLRVRPGWQALRLVSWFDCDLVHQHALRGEPVQWSVQVALCHAAQLGAADVDLYGCDGAAGGTPIDCTGHPGENRGPARWVREERDLGLTIGLCAARGATIHRIAP